ncbi:hypothetical protein EON80_06875 [bacterium]|nr:MAG: hypothetical protein EON80_06875 [bacterium]
MHEHAAVPVLTPEDKLLARLLWDALKNSKTERDLASARETFKNSSLAVRSALLRAEFAVDHRDVQTHNGLNPFDD